ncbi:MAG TPA: hypothetical protein VH394_27405 [Thermoanaerobaculia bacterium]|jgi:photosystem II stability/assembly factor-like uncharacterized protein|nr:hypothetical protein [Thermoanaerobaculia bacterium]
MKKLIALILLLLPLAAKAGVNRWTPFGRGDDTVLDLLLEPEGLYAVTSDGRVFRSADGGEAWQYWGLGLDPAIRRIAADPEDSRTMTAVGTHGDVYRSVDAGRFWSRLPRRVDEENDPAVASLETAAGTIYAGGRYLYLSRDQGETWSVANLGSIPSINVDPSDPRTVWFATTGGLWKTTDAGETFTLALNPPYEIGQAGVTAVGVSPSRPGTVYAGANRRIYSSQDGGATWQTGGDVGISDLSSLVVDPDIPMKVYATGPAGIALSLDGGATWEILAVNLATSSLILAADGTLFAGTYGDGLYASQDAGRSWSRRDRVGMGYPVTTFIKRHPRSLSVLYLFHATIGPGLLRSLDDGRTWAAFSDVPVFQNYLVDLAFDKSRPAILYVASFSQGAWRIEPDGTAKRMPVPTQREMYTVATSGRVVLIGNSWAAYRSGDFGETWVTMLPHVVRQEPGGEVVRSVLQLVTDKFETTVYALTLESGPGGSRYVALWSPDTGRHWRVMRSGDLNAMAVDQAHHDTLYIAERDRDRTVLLRSRDHGRLWQKIGTVPGTSGGGVFSLVVDRKHPGVLWASNDLGVLRSEDGGRTWAPFNFGLERPGLTDLVRLTQDTAARGRLYAMPAGGGLFELTTP